MTFAIFSFRGAHTSNSRIRVKDVVRGRTKILKAVLCRFSFFLLYNLIIYLALVFLYVHLHSADKKTIGTRKVRDSTCRERKKCLAFFRFCSTFIFQVSSFLNFSRAPTNKRKGIQKIYILWHRVRGERGLGKMPRRKCSSNSKLYAIFFYQLLLKLMCLEILLGALALAFDLALSLISASLRNCSIL